ncbi:genomic island protein [Pseudomonas cannabina pv. alisalensis]|uniref:Genomic island protein n=1 Tax=Pseudomonas syringae pv. maculicola str. ES4326 TaxID=629265 RepID=A0A8T8C0E8_PSEYM|nr:MULTISPECIES: portal protein [Pseudomonas syringae group]QHE96856.1 genomic island protein [Pseudomonas syringae pv. maculicola str. ES4326]UBY97515.1 genomic island protein [Pseudomonas cannabina pv. alisalensis]
MADNSPEARQKASENWARYVYGCNRGHTAYIEQARVCEDFYMGGGRQWSETDRQILAQAGRPCLEFNQIKNKINAAVGYQIGNRMDIGFRPRAGAADADTASTLSKLAMQIADNNSFHSKETQVFADGMIQQRGYFDIRMSYEDTILGEVRVDILDPLDVIPDPDANSYDPDDWADVTVTRFMTQIEIEALYGTSAKKSIEDEESDSGLIGIDGTDHDRNGFGDDEGFVDEFLSDEKDKPGKRHRVVDRQFWQMDMAEVIITPTGDIRLVEDVKPEVLAQMIENGGIQSKRRIKRVRWLVSTKETVLHDDWSPFNHFTVVPFFPTFRRGHTRGLVDDAIGPQQLLNKAMSQYLHVLNTSANSGWITVAGTLANMRDEELANRGSETGLHLMIKSKTPVEDRPQKIQPNQVPTGIDRLIDRAGALLEQSTGINEAMSGNQGNEVSGIAIQTRQFAAQQQLAVPLDNLARTRQMLATRMLEMIQVFYDQPRIIRITETDPRGKETTAEIPLNWPQSDARILNDLTIGEYDVIVSEAPAQITFENSQFLQAIELNDKGANIPWPFIIGYSNLANKQEIIDSMDQQPAPPVDPTLQAKADQLAAQTKKMQAETVAKSVEAQYSAIQTAATIATTPATSSLADALLMSAGYVDNDAAPIVPEYSGTVLAAPDLPENTNPLTPANPGVGLNAGIETPRIEGAPAQ